MHSESYPVMDKNYPPLAGAGRGNGYMILPLCDLKEGQSGVIISMDAGLSEGCRKLLEMGVSIFSPIKVLFNHDHHLIFDVERKRIATDRTTLSKIIVRTIG